MYIKYICEKTAYLHLKFDLNLSLLNLIILRMLPMSCSTLYNRIHNLCMYLYTHCLVPIEQVIYIKFNHLS